MKQPFNNTYKTIYGFTKRNARILAILWIIDFGLYLLTNLLYYIYKNPVFDFIATFAFGLMFLCLTIKALVSIRTISVLTRHSNKNTID